MDEFHRVNKEVLSIMVHQIQLIIMAIRAGHGTCHVDEGKEVRFACFTYRFFSVVNIICTIFLKLNSLIS